MRMPYTKKMCAFPRALPRKSTKLMRQLVSSPYSISCLGWAGGWPSARILLADFVQAHLPDALCGMRVWIPVWEAEVTAPGEATYRRIL